MPVPSPLAPGQSLLLVNGVPTPVNVAPNTGDNGLAIQGDGWSMNLDGLGPDGKPLNLGPNGSLILKSDLQARTSGTGFLPNSQVDLFLDPPTEVTASGVQLASAAGTYVGTVTVDADGNFDGVVTLPEGIAPGEHILQAAGFSPTNQLRAMNLGVTVEAWILLNKGTRTKDGRNDRIRTTGDSGGIAPGTKLAVSVKFSNQSKFTKGKATIVVQSDGSFTWTRLVKPKKTITAFMSHQGLKSNAVTWKRTR